MAKTITQQIIVFTKKPFVTNAKRKATWLKYAGLLILTVVSSHKKSQLEGQRSPTPDDELPLYCLGSHSSKPIIAGVELNGTLVSMEVDTGAAVSLMSQAVQERLFFTSHTASNYYQLTNLHRRSHGSHRQTSSNSDTCQSV